MKWAGLFLILLSCSGLGFRAAGILRRRIRECQSIERSFLGLASEIRYGQLPMAEALRQAARRGSALGRRGMAVWAKEGALGQSGDFDADGGGDSAWTDFFLRTASRLERCDDGTFCQIWQEELAEYLQGSVLREEGLLLQEIGTQLGSLDMEEQCMALDRFLQKWRNQICELQEQEKREGHLYRSFGICAGLFLVLILI